MREPTPRKRKRPMSPPSESEFFSVLARVAVAQICQSVGFKGSQGLALNALTDIATRYLKATARLASAAANSNGRTQSNVLDIIVALQELASVRGFPGLSTLRSSGSCSLCSSAVVTDLIKFVEYTEEIPFAHPLPPTTSSRGARGNDILTCKGDDDRTCYLVAGDGGSHVPRWLPAVPAAAAPEEARELDRNLKWESWDGRRNDREDKFGMSAAISKTESFIYGNRGKVRFKMVTKKGSM